MKSELACPRMMLLNTFLKRASLLSVLVFTISAAASSTIAQHSNSRGTPAESKPGQSSTSTYARDKIETVNLANGNFSLSIPLATVGGRGSVAYTIALSYNSKVWSAQQDREEVFLDGGAEGTLLTHYSAMYEKEILEYEPGVAKLGGGWTHTGGAGDQRKNVRHGSHASCRMQRWCV